MLQFPKRSGGFGWQDLLLYNGEQQVIMDGRAAIDAYGSFSMQELFDGNPETKLGANASGGRMQVRPVYGAYGTHFIFVVEDANRLAGVSMVFLIST